MANSDSNLNEIYALIRNTIRAIRGLPPEDDPFSGLVEIKDVRETTKVSELEIWGHTAMRTIAEWYPEDMGFWKDIAEMEDHYFKSKDGEQWNQLIALKQSSQQAPSQNVIVGQPLTQPQPQEKGGFFRRKPKEEKKPQ